MIMYMRIRRKIQNKVCFDKWFGDILVHYNYYANSIEIKKIENNSFNTLYDVKIRPFMKVDYKYKDYIVNCL